MTKVPLSQGLYALVDDCDAERVLCHKWTATYAKTGNRWYALRRERTPDGKRRCVFLHRFILGEPVGMDVEHENRDGLDCRRSNLRLATRTLNNANRGKVAGTSSRYKGVSLRSDTGKWRAEIVVDGRKVNLGCYDSEEAASYAYDCAAVEAYGSYARTNMAGNQMRLGVA